ncbi:MAG: hypothetical protein IIX36_02985 [Clostridia bacterium]|nr:hypothetical protein [Clostridia bacterium]
MDPPDFNFENLGDILGSLSQEDIDRLSSLAGQFMGGEKAQEPCREETGGGFNLDPDMIFRLMNIINKLQSRQNDPRCNLIVALKPLLSPERRQKADTAIELLRLMSIFSLKDLFGTE